MKESTWISSPTSGVPLDRRVEVRDQRVSATAIERVDGFLEHVHVLSGHRPYGFGRDQEKCAGLPLHYLFGAIPVGSNA
jgi:hypothetical protein